MPPWRLHEHLGRYNGIPAVYRCWHALCVADPVAAHPFTHPWLHAQHTGRLAACIAAAAGGPALHKGDCGDESHVQRLHAGNGVHVGLDEACLRLFDQALADCGIPPEPAARLCAYFGAAAEAMRAYGHRAALCLTDCPCAGPGDLLQQMQNLLMPEKAVTVGKLPVPVSQVMFSPAIGRR
jgi:hemoglobin